MAIENKPASAYAKNGTSVANGENAVVDTGSKIDSLRIAVGGISKGNDRPTKTDGVKQRGSGCATKGFTSRGPMA
jgi:hypothetical protein